MTLRPCLTCNTPTRGTYCRAHERDRHLATRLLPTIIQRDRGICQLCGEPIGAATGKDPTLHHVNHDVTDDRPANLQLAHRGCNAAEG